MSALTRSLSKLAVVVACVTSTAVMSPSAASANTGDGTGGAPYTITTHNFTAYGCTYYATNQHIKYYNCTGGVRADGVYYSGTKCVRYNVGWGRYDGHCRHYV